MDSLPIIIIVVLCSLLLLFAYVATAVRCSVCCRKGLKEKGQNENDEPVTVVIDEGLSEQHCGNCNDSVVKEAPSFTTVSFEKEQSPVTVKIGCCDISANNSSIVTLTAEYDSTKCKEETS